jgi:hypothetical protein
MKLKACLMSTIIGCSTEQKSGPAVFESGHPPSGTNAYPFEILAS